MQEIELVLSVSHEQAIRDAWYNCTITNRFHTMSSRSCLARVPQSCVVLFPHSRCSWCYGRVFSNTTQICQSTSNLGWSGPLNTMVAWTALGHILLWCVSSFVFLPQIIKLITICSPESYYAHDVGQQTLGSGLYHYCQNKDLRHSEFVYMELPQKWSSHISHKMSEYCKKATANQDEEPLFQQDPTYKVLKYMSLAAQYGLLDDMDIGDLGQSKQTINQEYQAYMMAPCLPKNTDPLKFWEVGGDTNGAWTLLTTCGRCSVRLFQLCLPWQWTICPSRHQPFLVYDGLNIHVRVLKGRCRSG